MAARSSRYLALLVSASCALGGATGCVEDGVSVHVICPMVPDVENMGCLFEPTDETCVGGGVVNLAVASSYQLNLRVESGLVARARQVPPQGEPNGVQIRGAEIELRDARTGGRLQFADDVVNGKVTPVPNPYDVVASGYIAPSETAGILFSAIDARHLNQLIAGAPPAPPKLPQIVVAVKLKGETNGGGNVEAGEYIWPLQLINVDPRPAANQCRKVEEFCGAGQDLFADVCL